MNCGVSWWLQLQFDSGLGTSICRKCGPKKTKINKQINKFYWSTVDLQSCVQGVEIRIPFFFFEECMEVVPATIDYMYSEIQRIKKK